MKVPGVGVPDVAEHMLMSYSVTLTMLYVLAFQCLKVQQAFVFLRLFHLKLKDIKRKSLFELLKWI